MATASLTPEAQQLISKYQLGTPKAVYKPNTIGGVIVALIMLAFFAGWTLLALAIFHGISLFSTSFRQNLPISDQTFAAAPNTVFQVFGIIFPLFGALLMVVALVSLVRTIGNRHSRAVVCANGVACITRKRADGARWEDILTVIHGVDVKTTRTYNQTTGFTSTSTRVSHKYTVHCHDGRKILSDKTSCGRKVEELGETLQVELARRQQARRP